MSTEFYAAFIKDSYHVEGDERSRTNPGHGYHAHNVDYLRVEKFKDKNEMEKWVRSRESSMFNRDNYEIVKYTNMKVTIKTIVEVDVK
jgi:hypothetical protein